MKQFQSTILVNKEVARDFYYQECSWDSAETPGAGQFFTVRVQDSATPLLRRPFAFSGYDSEKGTISYIYQKKGPATEILACKKAGDTLDILGPLGRGFSTENAVRNHLVLAGGVGVGPMLFTATQIAKAGGSVRFIFGARNSSYVPDLPLFNACFPEICTDDGSRGFFGNVIDYIKTLKDYVLTESRLLTCGPGAMQKAAHLLAVENGIECFVSMEEVMACGVGACMGCVVKTVAPPGVARACKEGPVFNSRELVWT